MFDLKLNFRGNVRKALESADSKIKFKLTRALKSGAENIKKNIASFAPQKGGDLKRRIMSLPVSNVRSRGFSFLRSNSSIEICIKLNRKSDKKILWVNNGTGLYGPHHMFIVPKNKPYLVFKINGRWIRKFMVRGQRGQFFIEKGLNKSKESFREKIRGALRS